jgi:hypothetical protein
VNSDRALRSAVDFCTLSGPIWWSPVASYFVTKLSSTGNQDAAEVLAYDDQSIKTVQVKW